MLMIAATMAATVPRRRRPSSSICRPSRCKEFSDSSKENIGLIVMWLDGYYSEEDAPPVVDFDKMKVNGGKIGEYCRKYPGHSVITAAEKVMGQ